MKNLTTIVSALLLAVVFTAPAKAGQFESFGDTENNNMIKACYLSYEVKGGAFFLGLQQSRGELDCWTVGGDNVVFPYESVSVSYGPQFGVWDMEGWVVLVGAGLGYDAENWGAIGVGVDARAMLGVGGAMRADFLVDANVAANLGFGVEGGQGLALGASVTVTMYGQVGSN